MAKIRLIKNKHGHYQVQRNFPLAYIIPCWVSIGPPVQKRVDAEKLYCEVIEDYNLEKNKIKVIKQT